MATKERKVIQKVKGVRAVDGVGVSLVRVLGNETVYDFDPFLMLDSFDSTNPDDYRRGFPALLASRYFFCSSLSINNVVIAPFVA